MKTPRYFALAAVLFAGLVAAIIAGRATAAPVAPDADPTELIPIGATWHYLDNGSLPAPGWTTASFDDSGWASGVAQLGYGDGDEATTIGFGPDPANRHITTYFRHTFALTSATGLERLKLSLLKDDGAVVYLNGTEIFRISLPTGPISPTTTAVDRSINSEEDVYFQVAVDAPPLLVGDNVLAVEVHQFAADSSDLSFDLSLTAVPVLTATTAPRNVILFIGDGMGPAHLLAAGYYQHGAGGLLAMESLPYQTRMSTFAANDNTTDSAASATAMATGRRVNNQVIAQALPGDGSDLATILEFFDARCRQTGLVTTAHLTHATPAAFGAHEPSRGNYGAIAADYLNETQPTVMLGGGENGLTAVAATTAGYQVVADRAALNGVVWQADMRLAGLFGATHMPYEYDYATGVTNAYDTWPHLTEMVTKTLALLNHNPDGFFLLVEGGRIDHAGHVNAREHNIFETLAFDRAIAATLEWANVRDDTLIIVTADHETGGLAVVGNNGAGNFPDVTWSTGGHTAGNVDVFAWGHNAELVAGVANNTDIFRLMMAGQPTLPPGECLIPVAVTLAGGGAAGGPPPFRAWLLWTGLLGAVTLWRLLPWRAT